MYIRKVMTEQLTGHAPISCGGFKVLEELSLARIDVLPLILVSRVAYNQAINHFVEEGIILRCVHASSGLVSFEECARCRGQGCETGLERKVQITVKMKSAPSSCSLILVSTSISLSFCRFQLRIRVRFV